MFPVGKIGLQAEYIMALPPWQWVYLIDWHVWFLVSLALFKNMKQSYDVLHIYWFHPSCVGQMMKVLWDWGCPEANRSVRNLSWLQHMVQLCFLFSGKRWVKSMIWLDSSPESVWVKMLGDAWVWGRTGAGEPRCTSPACVRLDRPFSIGYRGALGTATAERPRWRTPEGAVTAVEASSLLPACQPRQRQMPGNPVWRMGKGSRHLWQ